MSLIDFSQTPQGNPLDAIEQMATLRSWAFERDSDDEVTLFVSGRFSEYHLSFTWMHDLQALHLACAFDLKAPARCRPELLELISMVNEQMWIGHFDFWTKDGLIMFRQALMLAGVGTASESQCEALLAIAVDSCERYFTAFQFVTWAGKTAREALDATLFETSGEA
jgi:hypothetical protein